MPVYEYECEQCSARSSQLLSADSEESANCPSCGANKLRRIVSRFSRGRTEADRVTQATANLARADDQTTGVALAEVGRACDEDISETISAMYEHDQEGS